MKKGYAATIAGLAMWTGTAAAQDWTKNLYVRGDTGASLTTSGNRTFGSNDFDNSYIVGGGIGYRFTQNLRTDITLGYRGGYRSVQTTNSGGVVVTAGADVDALVGMVNGYYDIATYAGFTPYLGVGIGATSNHFGQTTVTNGVIAGTLNDNTSTDFAWQVSAGVSYSVTPNWAVDFGYRYLDMGQVRNGNLFTVFGISSAIPRQVGDLQAHEIQLGLRYSF